MKIIGRDITGASADIFRGIRARVLGENEDGDLLVAIRGDLYEEGMVARGNVDNDGLLVCENYMFFDDICDEYNVEKDEYLFHDIYHCYLLFGYKTLPR